MTRCVEDLVFELGCTRYHVTPALTLTLTLGRCVEELVSELGCTVYHVYESDYGVTLQGQTIDTAAVSTWGALTT